MPEQNRFTAFFRDLADWYYDTFRKPDKIGFYYPPEQLADLLVEYLPRRDFLRTPPGGRFGGVYVYDRKKIAAGILAVRSEFAAEELKSLRGRLFARYVRSFGLSAEWVLAYVIRRQIKEITSRVIEIYLYRDREALVYNIINGVIE